MNIRIMIVTEGGRYIQIGKTCPQINEKIEIAFDSDFLNIPTKRITVKEVIHCPAKITIQKEINKFVNHKFKVQFHEHINKYPVDVLIYGEECKYVY